MFLNASPFCNMHKERDSFWAEQINETSWKIGGFKIEVGHSFVLHVVKNPTHWGGSAYLGGWLGHLEVKL